MAKSSSEYIYHFGAVRLRVEGAGNLNLKLIGPSEVKTAVLVPLVMQSPTDESKTKLANFKSERAQLEFRTTEIDEIFEISRIIFFTKATSTGYPG